MKDKTGVYPLRIAASITALCSIMLSGCGTNATKVTDFSRIKLSRYDYALYAGPQRSDRHMGNTAYTIFINKNGDYTMHKHSVMDAGEISWTSEGLFYADKNHDYWLADNRQPKEITSEKTDLQDGLVSLNNNEIRVGIYNKGYTKNGIDYDEQVVISSKNKSNRFRAHYQYGTVVACNNDVYGITSDNEDEAHKFREYHTIDRLVENSRFAYKQIAKRTDPLDEFDPTGPLASCTNNRIVFLGAHHAPDNTPEDTEETRMLISRGQKNEYDQNETYTIETMDTASGQWAIHPLINPDGSTFLSQRFRFEFSSQEQDSIRGEELYWLHGDGRLLKTNISTGVTTVVNDTLYKANPKPDKVRYHFALTEKTASILVEDIEKPKEHIFIYTFDLKTGKQLSKIPINGLSGQLRNNMVLRGFAARPR